VPGGLLGAVVVGVPPLVLMSLGVIRNETESVGATNELIIGLGIVALGVALYFASPGSRRKNPS
jgi:hypothetical protein